MRAPASAMRRPAAPPKQAQHTAWRMALGFAAAFLIGYLPGIWLGRSGSSAAAQQLAVWYMDKQNFALFPTVLADLLSVSLLQLTLILLCGLSAAGVPLLAMLFGARGFMLGLCASGVFGAGGARSLVIYWLMSCLQDLVLLVAELWLSMYAAGLAGGLFQEVFGSGAPRGALSGSIRRLFLRYIVSILISVLFCTLGSGLDILLASVLL